MIRRVLEEPSRKLLIRPVANRELDVAFKLLHQLRTSLSLPLFRDRLERQERAGYRLYGAFDPELAGLLGMRPVATMARGYHLHVDDLVVDSARRGEGIGAALMEFVESAARENGMVSVFLDSRPEVLEFYGKLGYVQHTAILVRKSTKESA